MKTIRKTFDLNGGLIAEVSFENEKMNGTSTFWHDNQKIKSEGNYINNRKFGLDKWVYLPSNKVIMMFNYRSNIKCGAKIEFEY